MSDALRALAFAFRRRGGGPMERAKLLHMLTFDLRWYSPDSAKRLLQAAIAAGLVRETDGVVAPDFDVAAVDVPVNFRPRDEEPDLPTHAPRAPPTRDDDAEKERARMGGLVSLDVARLIAARRRGEDVASRARELEARLLSRAGAP